GDRGGNAIMVRRNGRVTNLHSLWDGRLGNYQSGRTLDRVAERAVSDNPLTLLGAAARPAEPERYAAESVELARWWVYLSGALPYALDDDGAPELPEGYDVASAAIARRRVAQAGYRLGAELN